MTRRASRRSFWWVGGLALLAVALPALLGVQAAREEAGQERTLEWQASQWLQLDAQEWRSYRSRRALIGKPLAEMTPYEVLGIYADDPEAQRRYARENARFMLDFYRRTMAFEAIYRDELGKLATAKKPTVPDRKND